MIRFESSMLAWRSKEQAARMETKRPTTYRYMLTLFLVGTGGGDGGGETPILGVRIASLLANPEGEDQGKESITLTNQATTTIDLSGWKLRDRAGVKRPFPVNSRPAPARL